MEKSNENLDKNETIAFDADCKLDYDLVYQMRRHKQIENAKHKANLEKRKKQKQTKKEQEQEQKERDEISISLIKELVGDNYEQTL